MRRIGRMRGQRQQQRATALWGSATKASRRGPPKLLPLFQHPLHPPHPITPSILDAYEGAQLRNGGSAHGNDGVTECLSTR